MLAVSRERDVSAIARMDTLLGVRFFSVREGSSLCVRGAPVVGKGGILRMRRSALQLVLRFLVCTRPESR